MKCPICGHEINEDNQNRCSRFPICSFVYQNNNTSCDDRYILFDIETTGLNKNKDRIIEIGAIKVENNQIIDNFSMLINPGRDSTGNQIFINSRITEITGITNDMVKDMKEESEAIKEYIDWVGDISVFAGQNIIKFDIPFINAAAKRADLVFNCTSAMDTLSFARKLKLKDQGLQNLKQSTLAEYYGFTYNAHRALDDVNACYKILNYMKKDGIKSGITIRPEILKRS